jgi:hypothetical protein
MSRDREEDHRAGAGTARTASDRSVPSRASATLSAAIDTRSSTLRSIRAASARVRKAHTCHTSSPLLKRLASCWSGSVGNKKAHRGGGPLLCANCARLGTTRHHSSVMPRQESSVLFRNLVGARGFEPPTPRSRTEPRSPEVSSNSRPPACVPNDGLTTADWSALPIWDPNDAGIRSSARLWLNADAG